jgi:hypothetical protein
LCFFYLIFILLIVFYLPFVKLPFIFKFTHQCFLFFISISILILLIVFFLFVKLPFLLNFTLIKFILYFNFDPYSFNCYFLFLILLYNWYSSFQFHPSMFNWLGIKFYGFSR